VVSLYVCRKERWHKRFSPRCGLWLERGVRENSKKGLDMHLGRRVGSELGGAQIYYASNCRPFPGSELRRAQTWPPCVELGRAQTCCPGRSWHLECGRQPVLLRSNNNCCIARPMRHSRLLLGLAAAALLGSAGPSEVPETFGDHACAGGVGVLVSALSCKPPWNGTPPIPT